MGLDNLGETLGKSRDALHGDSKTTRPVAGSDSQF